MKIDITKGKSRDELAALYLGKVRQLGKVEREIEIRKASMDRYGPCSDHNGKAPGGCLMCKIERLRESLRYLLDWVDGMPIKHPQQDAMRKKARALLSNKGDGDA